MFFYNKKSLWLHLVTLTFIIVMPAFFFFCGSGTSGDANERSDEPPQAVFLVVVDTLRADRLSCYGFKSHQTPNIDRLASTGVTFNRAHANASWTRPSMGVVMTSSYPSQLGFVEIPAERGTHFKWRQKRGQINFKLPAYKQTLAEVMQSGGFHTGAFVNQPVLNTRNGFQRGYDDYFYPVGKETLKQLSKKKAPFYSQKDVTLGYALENDQALITRFDGWLEERSKKEPGKKIFAWIHLLTPHKPYLPPEEYKPKISGNSPAAQSAAYNGEILASDQMIGQVVDSIQRHVGLKKSLIIFTADHGEEFKDHGMMEHGHTLHRAVVHVPLIVVSPLFPAGKKINLCVGLINLLPTIADIAGIGTPAKNPFEGTSLVPVIWGAKPEMAIFAEGMLYGSTERSLMVDGFKLMYDEQFSSWSLYDIARDADEKNDLYKTEIEKGRELRSQLEVLYGRIRAQYHVMSHKYPVKKTKEDEKRNANALRSLGYL